MIEEKEFRGYWWVPEQPEDRVGGIATFSPQEGINLTLFSALNQNAEHLGSDEPLEYDTLFGISTDGEKITLRDCMRTSYGMSSSGDMQINPSKYVAISMFVGDHLSQGTRFPRASVSFSLLSQWAEISGVEYSGFGEDSVEISYEPWDSANVNTNDIQITLQSRANFNIQRVGGATIDEDIYFNIDSSNGGLLYDEILDYVRLLQDFISLGAGKEVRMSELIGSIESSNIEFLFSSAGPTEVSDNLHPLKANFTYSDISDEFGTVLSNWFNQAEELEPVYNLYFGTQYNEDMYVQNQFLSFTRAIDIYHRRYFNGEYMSNQDFEKIRSNIRNALPVDIDQQFKENLIEVLNQANEYSLSERLLDIIYEYEDILSELPWNYEEEISRISESQEYFTRYDQNLEPKVDSQELPEINLLLRSIIETVLLSEIGISRNQIKERLSKRYSERV